VVIFAPLYISNLGSNNCLYCGFRSENPEIARKKLSMREITAEAEALLAKGHKRVLMVAGETSGGNTLDIDFFEEALRTLYSARYGRNGIRRVNVNSAPLSVSEFRRLKSAGIGTYQIFQETYHDATYRTVHPRGPKSDPDNRLDAVARAFEAGIDDIGIGVLYGLYDHKFETLGLLAHIESMEKAHGVGPHTISVPRLEPAKGADLSTYPPYRISDGDFKKIVAVLRISVPYTGIILSTRETAELRDELFGLGVSQISAGSSTRPGGYSEAGDKAGGQFDTSDMRTLDEVMSSLLDKKAIPSFCTACYRTERTGKAFMALAKPGTIQGKCRVNALLTLKEYLDDFASSDVRRKGYGLIEREMGALPEAEKKYLEGLFTKMDKGARDGFV
ncbi:MAG: [FeFe] hydrogenase H-cluster radical SAM maturase HydG, partial [Candidatus Omnitrophica bacterium]|nr:[FeFe] hydrogenase H-cluster radical SAM maturase HydG [Candidatus Omnitrophota bacterium]